jgi:hypothetical protein
MVRVAFDLVGSHCCRGIIVRRGWRPHWVRAEPSEQRRRIANYLDKILRGAKPADLFVNQPTKLELVINLNSAERVPPLNPAVNADPRGQRDPVVDQTAIVIAARSSQTVDRRWSSSMRMTGVGRRSLA